MEELIAKLNSVGQVVGAIWWLFLFGVVILVCINGHLRRIADELGKPKE